MRDRALFTCDECGVQGIGFIPEGWADYWPPEGWTWGFGFEAKGPHACSPTCWAQVNAKHRQQTGKMYIPDTHGRWSEARPLRDPATAAIGCELPPPAPAPPIRIEARDDKPDPLPRRGGLMPPPARTIKREEKRVYFAQDGDGGPIKIGVSGQVEERMRSLQRATPRPLRLLATIPGSHRDERDLHKRFAELRIHGEWFKAEAPLLEFIQKASA